MTPRWHDGAVPDRVILHVDMDAFFVSVELLRRPDLRGRPVVVGGTGRRGVVAAASYEARRFGVFSAMPSMRARRLCPDAVFLAGDYDAYAAVSAQVFEIFRSFTPHVESISLDEAFLDVTGSVRLFGGGSSGRSPGGHGVAIAQQVRAEVSGRTRLSCSVGVAPNMFLAKMASVEAKPKAGPHGVDPGPGVFEIRPGDELDYLHPLPVRRLWGVGPATHERLTRLGVRTIGDLAAASPVALRGVVGPAAATRLGELARGIDERRVDRERPIKSVSHEETYAYDLHERDDLRTELARLADGVASRLRADGLAARTISLKVRDATFRTITRARTLPRPVDSAAAITDTVVALLDKAAPSGGVRLLGVAASKFSEPAEQLQLDGLGPDHPARGDASAAIDRVRGRFGGAAIGPASALSPAGLRVVRRGQHQWGTDDPVGAGEDPRPAH
jgi:DNA polymerase IV